MEGHYTSRITTSNKPVTSNSPITATSKITLERSSLHSISINKHHHTNTSNTYPSLHETTATPGSTHFNKMQAAEPVDDEDAMSISPAAVHFHPAMPRPTRESVLQRLSEALLRRSLTKVRKERAREIAGFAASCTFGHEIPCAPTCFTHLAH